MSILAKYINYYIYVFSKKSVLELPKRFIINKYLIDLEFSKYLLYKLIYSLKLVEFKTFKTYIRINLVNNFICSFKYFANALNLVISKPNGSFYL